MLPLMTVAAMSTATTQTELSQQTVSRRLAAEDICVGSYITVVQQVSELVSFLWFGDMSAADREQPVMYRHTPCNSGEPFRVLAVCLPFVFAENLHGEAETFDLRHCEVARLSGEYVDVVRRKQKKATADVLGKKRRRAKRKSKRRRK